MYTARISFPLKGREPERVVDAAYDILSVWLKNGQIVGDDWPFVTSGPSFDVYVTIPEPGALQPEHDNRYAAAALRDLRERGLAPAVQVLGNNLARFGVCECESRSALLLFTHFLETVPPVKCLECFLPVPLYRLPYEHDQEHLGILQWEADYRACDTLQMHCGTGERFAERQMFHHESSLTRNGRDLCAKLESLIQTPVFYYLHKARGRSRAKEHARKCPLCGRDWRLEVPLHGIFDFRCDGCRLLSSVALSVR